MLNFDNIEDLAAYMFEKLDNTNHVVSVISNKEITIEILRELLNYESIILGKCEIDYDKKYNREYIISLFDDVESDFWYVNIEKSYLTDKNKYISTDGYVLFHEDVNSKSITDMENNTFMPLEKYDWFIIGESENEDDKTSDFNDIKASENTLAASSSAIYKINEKEVNKDTYETELERIKEMYFDNMKHMLLGHAEFMNRCDELKKLFRLYF